jgi:hypothetical protein
MIYKILNCANSITLEMEVNRFLELGYEIHGEMIFSDGRFIQAMVLKR